MTHGIKMVGLFVNLLSRSKDLSSNSQPSKSVPRCNNFTMTRKTCVPKHFSILKLMDYSIFFWRGTLKVFKLDPGFFRNSTSHKRSLLLTQYKAQQRSIPFLIYPIMFSDDKQSKKPPPISISIR